MNETTLAQANPNRQSHGRTEYGAVDDADVSFVQRNLYLPIGLEQPNGHKWIAGWTIIVCSASWLAGFLISRTTAQTLPWAVALGTAGMFTLFWLAKRSNDRPAYVFKIGETRTFVISDGLALSLCAASVLVLSLMWFQTHAPHTVQMVRRQVIDIELVSANDAVDRHDILPGTEKKADEQKKIQSNAVKTQQGKTLVVSDPKQIGKQAQPPAAAKVEKQIAATPTSGHPAPSKDTDNSAKQPSKIAKTSPKSALTNSKTETIAAKSAPAENGVQVKARAVKAVSPQPEKPMGFITHAPASNADHVMTGFSAQQPSKWQTRTTSQIRIRPASRGIASFEEVAPPEMVELTDSDGENRAQELWQSGGRSANGKGAKSNLTAYLKELHRRIKRAWRPPGGETRTAEILFRIKRTGQLASIKLIRTSGSNELDDAAMVAIAGCAPFKTLPQDVPTDYLDLLYTFNYTVDSLAEAQKGQY